MSWLRKIWQIIKQWFGKRQSLLQTTIIEDMPETLEVGYVYLVGENGYFWFVAFLCPCGCQAKVQLSLLSGHPQWTLIQHGDGTISLQPSIWRIEGCHSHFFLRRSSFEWCKP